MKNNQNNQNNHYDFITSITAYLTCSYFCEKCNLGYQNKDGHKCNAIVNKKEKIASHSQKIE